MTARNALTLLDVWACVRVLAATAPTLPLHAFRRTVQGRERVAAEYLDEPAPACRRARSWPGRWDEHGPSTTKNGKERRVPIIGQVRECLVAQRLRRPPGVDLVLGLGEGRRFRADRLQERADAAWKVAGLQRLTLYDCRHTFASFAIAAGVNAKALCSAMGHSSVAITFDRCGHRMPGSEAEAAGLLDTYLGATG